MPFASSIKATRDYPALPSVGNTIESHAALLSQIKENIEIHERRTPNFPASFVRVEEMIDLGLLKVRGNQLVAGEVISGLSDSIAGVASDVAADLTAYTRRAVNETVTADWTFKDELNILGSGGVCNVELVNDNTNFYANKTGVLGGDFGLTGFEAIYLTYSGAWSGAWFENQDAANAAFMGVGHTESGSYMELDAHGSGGGFGADVKLHFSNSVGDMFIAGDVPATQRFIRFTGTTTRYVDFQDATHLRIWDDTEADNVDFYHNGARLMGDFTGTEAIQFNAAGTATDHWVAFRNSTDLFEVEFGISGSTSTYLPGAGWIYSEGDFWIDTQGNGFYVSAANLTDYFSFTIAAAATTWNFASQAQLVITGLTTGAVLQDGHLEIGDGDSADGDLLMYFNTDRDWGFEVRGNDATQYLALKAFAGAKSFQIEDPSEIVQHEFHQSTTLPFYRLADAAGTDLLKMSIDGAGNCDFDFTNVNDFNINSARLVLDASATAAATLNIPHGAAPTTPQDGDIWTTTAGLYVRINGSTVGPLS